MNGNPRMSNSDDRIAVLFALQTLAEQETHKSLPQPITGTRLFEHLPILLRRGWSQKHLNDVILRSLIYDGRVQARQFAGVVSYSLTHEGEALLEEDDTTCA